MKTTALAWALLWVLLFPGVSFTQEQFSDISAQTGLNYPINTMGDVLGTGISFYDINGDGWDDLTISTGHTPPAIYINNQGNLDTAPFTIPSFGSGYIVSVVWADYDNDGDADLLITRFPGPVELWQNDGNFNFTNVASSAGIVQLNIKHMAAAFVDYDHDGHLDLFVTTHPLNEPAIPENTCRMYRNNGDGTFMDVTQETGLEMPPYLMFQPVFLDINNDGWEDLLMIVDRTVFPNYLFLNNGDGTFTDISQSSGMDLTIDAMSGTVGDFDHDGDLDVFVANNPVPYNMLFRNNGDLTFTDVSAQYNVQSFKSCWGSLWLDYDNDSWEDLFITVQNVWPNTYKNEFFRNQGIGQPFVDVSSSMGIAQFPTQSFVAAMGDLNNDGYYDFAVSSRYPNPNRLYLNNGGSNHYLSVSLQGVLANRDAIGTWMKCYAGGKEYVRFTLSSENLFGQNSSKKIFGLGQIAQVDSLILEWNSGTVEKYYNLNVNQHLHLIEGASMSLPFTPAVMGATQFCHGDSVMLDAGLYETFLWNTGDTTQQIVVHESGIYSVVVTNTFGAEITSFPVEVEVYPAPVVNLLVNHVTCSGFANGSVLLDVNTGPVQDVLWNNGHTDDFLSELSGGVYTFSALDTNGCHVSGAVAVAEPPPLIAQHSFNNVLCFGEANGTAVVNITGGTPPYNIDWQGENPDSLSIGVYTVLVQDNNLCEWSAEFEITQPDSIDFYLFMMPNAEDAALTDVGVSIWGGTPPYAVNWSSGQSGFILWGVGPSDYSVLVSDMNNCQKEQNFTIPGPSSTHNTLGSSWQIFPNPARDLVNVSAPLTGNHAYRILGVAGKFIREGTLAFPRATVSVRDLPAGVYFLQIANHGQWHSIQLVVNGY
ncbi:MAG: T9SS C-terminal target domain-containing protein [Cryomorphaceae bacterium]|nr:MAG: T9SS C-terminal target domain-containing protein [Cryomorphaceae bacterium]